MSRIKGYLGLALIILSVNIAMYADRGEALFPFSSVFAVALSVIGAQLGVRPFPGTGSAPISKSFRLMKASELDPQ